jgi:hypothetical protein
MAQFEAARHLEEHGSEYWLARHACYLVAMSADGTKLEAAGLPTPELLATSAKSYQQLVREQKVRLRLKLEGALGL